MTIKSILAKLTNDCHVPIALVVLTATTVYHFSTHRDLGSQYVSSLYAFYGFLAGHAAVYQFKPDAGDEK